MIETAPSNVRRVVAALTVVVCAAAAVAAIALLGNPTGKGPKLAWAPPRLNAPQTVQVSAVRRSLQLDPKRDYVVRMPRRPLAGPGGLSISGGRNVVLIGGEIEVPRQGSTASIDARRGLLLTGQTGVVHVEGLRIRGAGLSEGIDLDERLGAIVQLENNRVEGIHARDERNFTDNHPDVVQSWAGPAVLRIDGLTATTDYQGLFLNPAQFGRASRMVDLRRVNIAGLPTARYLLWQAEPFPIRSTDVWINPAKGRPLGQVFWPSHSPWAGVRVGSPPRDFVPRSSVGTGYRSPGYR